MTAEKGFEAAQAFIRLKPVEGCAILRPIPGSDQENVREQRERATSGFSFHALVRIGSRVSHPSCVRHQVVESLRTAMAGRLRRVRALRQIRRSRGPSASPVPASVARSIGGGTTVAGREKVLAQT